ncbi:MAG: glycosyltransferase [Gemmatimonadetes bacterium]|nr:glycosyltransferase [Gemmatimonadota bacterium]
MSASEAPISVIVPCLNAEATLAEALDSALDQTVPPMEVLVIDDGGTDGSMDVARSMGPKVRVLRNRGRGPGAARRLGVEAARGEYIAFVDADDVVEPVKHEHQLNAFAEHGPETVVHTGSVAFWPDGSRPERLRAGGERAVGRCTRVIFERNPVCGASIMMRRSVLLELGNFDPRVVVAEDFCLLLAASTRCSFAFVPQPLYRRRRHATNVTNHAARMAWYHWLAQETFRRRFPEAFAELPAESVRQYMVEPVLNATREAYWRRDPRDYWRLLRLARSLDPEAEDIRRFWRRRWIPMAGLKMRDRLQQWIMRRGLADEPHGA